MVDELQRIDVAIPGLILIRGALSTEQQQFCVDAIDASPWRGDLRRRTQHYGYVYDYRARTVDASAYIGPLPTWLARLGALVSRSAGLATAWDQAIVNEYRAGTGIGEHTDARPFGPAVATVSLLSATTMRFRASYGAPTFVAVSLLPGDIAVMTGTARRDWTHEIVGSDVVARRLSVTFRTVGSP